MNKKPIKPKGKAPIPKKEISVGKGNGCPHFKKCGGCHLQNMTYKEQLQYKQVKVIKLLGRFCHIKEIMGMENPVHYRCKVQAAFGKDKSGIISGVYQSSTHKIVPIDSCMIEDEKADEIIVTIRKLLKSFKLKPFDENNMTGFLRHVLVRKGYYTGQIMVVLVTGTPVFPSSRSFINALLERHPEITTIVQNINNKFTSLVLGEKTITLYGDGYIEDSILDCTFRISPRSFYQVNPVMTTKLYSKAIEYMGLSGKETVIDTYCGTGTIGILASKNAGKVIGVELNADAVRDAKFNAKRNNIKNIEFYTADASDFMVEMAKAGKKADVVIMDPPRAGSDRRFINAVATLAPEKIVYISCNPETLERDLTYFARKGYYAHRIQPVDMFPHTNHVEAVALLSRKEISKFNGVMKNER
jgi:23S rRNA (uracil1939-C5)-methyltransferase